MSSPGQCLGVGRSDYDVPPGLLLLAQNPVLSAGGGSIHQLSSNCNRFLSKILRTGTAAAAPRIRPGADPLLALANRSDPFGKRRRLHVDRRQSRGAPCLPRRNRTYPEAAMCACWRSDLSCRGSGRLWAESRACSYPGLSPETRTARLPCSTG